MRIEGIFPPIITPFDEAGAVDEQRLRALVAFWAQHVHGMFVCGSYGSGPLLTVEERERVFEVVADKVAGRLPLVAHVGAVSTAAAVRLARHAEAHGAVAVGAIPPYYFTYGDQPLLEHYQTLVEAVSIPVYAYDNPKTTGNPISPALLDRLADLGLAGLKDSSFDIGKLYLAMRTVQRPGFDFVIGSESLMLPAFVMGVRGCIAGLGNVFPEAMRVFYTAAVSGTADEARQWQAQILKLWDVLHIGPSVPTAYEILHLRGIDAGNPRRPMLRLDADTRERVRQAMDALREAWQPDSLTS